MGSPFGPDLKVSSTRIVMLVAKGNPLGILRLEDLAKMGLRLGYRSSGEYTWSIGNELIRETGKFAQVESNITMMADTPTRSFRYGGRRKAGCGYGLRG